MWTKFRKRALPQFVVIMWMLGIILIYLLLNERIIVPTMGIFGKTVIDLLQFFTYQ